MNEPRKRMTYEQQRAAREGRPSVQQQASQRQSARQSTRTTARQAASQQQEQTPRQRLAQAASQRQAGSQRQAQTSRQTAQTASRQQSQAVRQSTSRQRTARASAETAAPRQIPFLKIGIVVVLLVAVVLGVRMCMAATPINVTVNGTHYELRGAKTMQTAMKASGLPINPGDLISLKGTVLEKSAGDPFNAKVNDVETADPDFVLRDGDTITLTDGKDIVEGYDVVEESVPYGATITGMGAVHKFEPGTEGVLETRTGQVSGEEVKKQTVDPVDIAAKEYNVNTGANKVIAFTFDDGPSSDHTATVLDILAENDAKATFFCIGTEVNEHPELVKREAEAGHQVCTHTYDHADPVGGTDVGLMSAAGQIDEVQHGMKTIADALGIDVSQVSTVARMPGGNLSEDMVKNLQPYISYEIGWNIDTQDWTLPGADAIYEQMISAQPGDIILCHDGGGDRSQTVEALRRALPYLKSKGFSFVTMDELLQYPASA